MKFKLTILSIIFCGLLSAQTNNQIKNFINKNAEALNEAQQILSEKKINDHDVFFKLLIKKQLRCVELFNSLNPNAFSLAVDLRYNLLNFIKNYLNSNNSLYLMTDEEGKFKINDVKFNDSDLSKQQINTINNLSVISNKIDAGLTLIIK